MNLLLLAESRKIIRQLRQEAAASGRPGAGHDLIFTLDDEIFEELGLHGTLSEAREGFVASPWDGFIEWLNGLHEPH